MQPAKREKEKKREREKEREQALLICVSAPRFLHLRGGNSGLSKLQFVSLKQLYQSTLKDEEIKDRNSVRKKSNSREQDDKM